MRWMKTSTEEEKSTIVHGSLSCAEAHSVEMAFLSRRTRLGMCRLAQLLSAEQVAYQKEIEAQYEAPDVTKQR